MRRLIALALPLVAAAGMLPAAAAPTAAAGRVAGVSVEVPLAGGGHLRVDLQATSTSAGDRLRVSTWDCDADCSSPQYFEGALPKGALSVDARAAKAALTTVLGGRSLKVRWEPSTATRLAGGTYGGGTDERTTFGTYRGDPAVAVVQLAAARCQGSASVGDVAHVSTAEAGDDGTYPLTSLRLPAVTTAACQS